MLYNNNRNNIIEETEDLRKRIKLSIPKLIKEILDKDTEYYGIKLEKLCNVVVQEMGYEETLRIHDKLKSDRKIPITFNLTDRNTKFLPSMLANSSEKMETEFFRSLLSTYTNLHPSLRERVIKKSAYIELELAIKNQTEVKISYESLILDIVPLSFRRDEETGYNYLEAESLGERYLYRLKDIEILKINL